MKIFDGCSCNLAIGFDLDFVDLIQKHIRLCGDTAWNTVVFLEADAATGSTGDRNDEMSKMLGFLIDLFWQGKQFIYLSIVYIYIFFCWRTVILANKHVHSTDTCTCTLHVRPYMTRQVIMYRNT